MTPPDILTVLGHDLKAPLNAVVSYLEIMQNRIMGESLDPYMPILEKSMVRLHQMRQLITDVVAWSRTRDPSTPRNPTSRDISEIARLILERYL